MNGVRKKKRNETRVTKEGGKPKSAHNEFTHFPMCPTCKMCLSAKMQKASRCSRDTCNMTCDALLPAVVFGDRLTVDHAIINKENKSAEDENLNACIIQDGATDWLQAYLCKTKGAADTLRCFQRFLGPDIKAKHVYTDNSKEFATALDRMCVLSRHLHTVHSRVERHCRTGSKTS